MKTSRETLGEQVTRIEEEARMVLPGIQAIFGFQLIAVFNNNFEKLSFLEQSLHYGALLCMTLATLLILTPAAYHRQVEVDRISEYFITLSSRLICFSMIAMAVGVCLDCYLIGRLVLHSIAVSAVVTSLLGLGFYVAWFGFPLWIRKHSPS